MSVTHSDENIADMVRIYHNTVHQLYRFVSRRAGGSRQLAEDVTQETYLRAVAQWRAGLRPESALAWLQTVARNLLLNHYRRKKPESLEALHLKDVLATAPAEGPDATALVYWGLARLRRGPGQLLEAFYIEGKSTRTIASELAISERSVEGRLRRARQALRKQLTRATQNHGDSS